MSESIVAYPGLLLWQYVAHLALRRFRSRLVDGPNVNRSTLLDILEGSQNTVIGRRLGFSDILHAPDPELAYRRAITVASYSAFEESIESIAAGSSDVLFPGEPSLFVATSGTSSDPKLLPMTRRAQNIYLRYIALLVPAMRRETAPDLRPGQRSINLMLASNPGNRLPGGKPLGMSSAGALRRVLWAAPFVWTSPAAVFELTTHSTALYLHALFGLRDESAGCIEAIFGSHIVSWMSLILNRQGDLLDDIAHGTINRDLQLSARQRRRLERRLTPDPTRAHQLEQAFAQGEAGIIPRLWPEMKVLSTVVSGAFAVSLPRLKSMAGDRVAIYTTCFGATESLVGINLWPDSPERYALALGAAYYEFLPMAQVEFAADSMQTLGIDDLEVGESYEVVVTTFAGLYRYRLGDVVRVTGHTGRTPVIEFDYRVGTVLDLAGEKTTEQHTRQVVQELAEEALGSPAAIGNYSVRGDLSVTPYRYLVYLELADERQAHEQDSGKLAESFDSRLQSVNLSYKTLARANSRLAQASVKLVTTGSFHALEEYIYAKNPGVSRNQIKVPRVLKDEQQIRLLEERAIG